MKYKVVASSRFSGPRFVIMVGLQENYCPTGKLHTIEEAVAIIESFLKECAASGRTYLMGSVTTNTFVYAWPENIGKADSRHEPNVVYSEKGLLHISAVTTKQVRGFLNGLAQRLGTALGQKRVYVAHDDDVWILQRENSTTPTGESV